MIRHLFRVARSLLRERAKRKSRSPAWARVERSFKLLHPGCAACASPKLVQVHHKKPFHLHPELELEPSNLVSLCMGPNECHLRIGHGDSFKCYNPNVEADAASVRRDPSSRRRVEVAAKAARLK